jgi:hypothetical protein
MAFGHPYPPRFGQLIKKARFTALGLAHQTPASPMQWLALYKEDRWVLIAKSSR